MTGEKVSKFCADLVSDLVKSSKVSNKVWQERYMKGAVLFRGVKNPQVQTKTLLSKFVQNMQTQIYPKPTDKKSSDNPFL
jgi:hypothetical protein